MTVNTASRFQVVESLIRNPGETLITKSTQGPFIDAGIDLGIGDRPAWRGRVYFSKDEVREMAEQLGLFESYAQAAEALVTAAEEDRQRIVDSYEETYRAQFDAGYAAGRAENLDHLADELVDRMRTRVARSSSDVASDARAVEDDSAAAPAAASVAAAPVVEDADGVQRPVADRKPKPGSAASA